MEDTKSVSLLYAKQMKFDKVLEYMYQILQHQRNKIGELLLKNI